MRAIDKNIGQDGTQWDGHAVSLRIYGQKFNDPNDVVVKSDGTVWFTDPLYFGVANQPTRSAVNPSLLVQ